MHNCKSELRIFNGTESHVVPLKMVLTINIVSERWIAQRYVMFMPIWMSEFRYNRQKSSLSWTSRRICALRPKFSSCLLFAHFDGEKERKRVIFAVKIRSRNWNCPCPTKQSLQSQISLEKACFMLKNGKFREILKCSIVGIKK